MVNTVLIWCWKVSVKKWHEIFSQQRFSSSRHLLQYPWAAPNQTYRPVNSLSITMMHQIIPWRSAVNSDGLQPYMFTAISLRASPKHTGESSVNDSGFFSRLCGLLLWRDTRDPLTNKGCHKLFCTLRWSRPDKGWLRPHVGSILAVHQITPREFANHLWPRYSLKWWREIVSAHTQAAKLFLHPYHIMPLPIHLLMLHRRDKMPLSVSALLPF